MNCRSNISSHMAMSLIFLVLILFVSLCAVCDTSAEERKNLPPRSISVAPLYPGVVVPQNKDVDIDLNVTNGGMTNEDINLTLTSIPEGWKAWIKTYNYQVTGVHVPSDDTKSLTFHAEQGENIGPGEYSFAIQAETPDKEQRSICRIIVTVQKETKEKKTKGVRITTSYPVLQGPSDAKFEFSLEVENETAQEDIFNLFTEGPENWDIKFKPAYEDKYFSSLRIKGGQSQTMAVEVKPYLFAEPGEYPIQIKVNSPEASGEAQLKVLLTGTYKLEVGTLNGLLSLNSLRGKESNISFYVINNGSATLNNLRFLSFKPENWQVSFNPENIETLSPGDRKQVEVKIIPSDQALVGDYSVVLSVEGAKEPKNLELRVTVKASTLWGWIGIGIIIIVVIGLVTLFIRFGRR
ncbi:MAG: hypothetical protein JW882_20060 [Deltaproteobacteria bacterium]|nr:hypothetical protein [Deltaproteobacteria bacterium]